jgi:hypothetical protein
MRKEKGECLKITFGLWKSLDKVRIRIRIDPHRTGSLDPKQQENLGETATQQ